MIGRMAKTNTKTEYECETGYEEARNAIRIRRNEEGRGRQEQGP